MSAAGCCEFFHQSLVCFFDFIIYANLQLDVVIGKQKRNNVFIVANGNISFFFSSVSKKQVDSTSCGSRIARGSCK